MAAGACALVEPRGRLTPPTPGRARLDHVFVTTLPGAPEIAALIDAGFADGTPNAHPGQGTACRRIAFENLYLELLWLEAGAEPGPQARAAGIVDRAGLAPGMSRLGVAIAGQGLHDAAAAAPIRWVPYAPPYEPDGSIRIAEGGAGPLVFTAPAGGRPVPPTPHANGARAVTRVAIASPHAAEAALAWLRRRGLARVAGASEELLEVDLDHGARGGRLDLRPSLPLVVRW